MLPCVDIWLAILSRLPLADRFRVRWMSRFFRGFAVPPVVDTLMPHQLGHVAKLYDHYATSGELHAVDTSMMGAGKTYTTCALASLLSVSLLVVCPTNVQANWAAVTAAYGCAADIVSYGKLRYGSSGFTTRVADESRAYRPTDRWRDAVAAGTLLVLDEIDSVKNPTLQTAAAVALTREVFAQAGKGRGTRSRVHCIAAIPFDKEEHIVHHLRLLGYLDGGRIAAWGANRVFEPDACARFIASMPMTCGDRRSFVRKFKPATKHKMLMDLYAGHCMPRTFFCMPPFEYGVPIETRCGYYPLASPSDEYLFTSGLRRLRESCRLIESGRAGQAGIMTRVRKALMTVATAKIGILGRVALRILRGDPRSKVVIAASFLEPIRQLAVLFGEHGIGVGTITGAVPAKKRTALVNAFNADSDGVRVIVGNIQCISRGISLHDVHGGRERWVLIVPNYNAIHMQQVARRTHRATSASPSHVRYVFCYSSEEKRLLRTICRKMAFMKALLHANVAPVMAFLNETGDIHEGDPAYLDTRPLALLP